MGGDNVSLDGASAKQDMMDQTVDKVSFFHIYYVLKIIGMWMCIRSGFWEVLCFWNEKSWPKIVPVAVTGGDNVFWDTANAKPDMMDQTADKVTITLLA